jgi:hypothetical protein
VTRKNGDACAFPVLHAIDGNWVLDPRPEFAGLTKREYFAGLALNGLLSNGDVMADVARLASMSGTEDRIPFALCDSALMYADALLAALEPQPF